MLIAAGVFALIFAIIFGTYWALVILPEDREDRALRKRLKIRRTSADPSRSFVKVRERLSAFQSLDTALRRSTVVTDPLTRLIEQAGLSITVGTVVLGSVFLAVVTFVLVTQFFRVSVLFALPLSVVAASLPVLYVKRAAQKRLALFEEQFPEAVDLMSRALRAGHALTTALQMVGDEIQDPVAAEFKLMFDQQNYGMSLPDALKAFAARMPILDARFFVTALLTQRETGGNLAEVLDNLASVIRERFKVKRQVRVISAHGRITGWVLGFLPPAVAAVIFIISPGHMRLLVDDPLGLQMTLTGIGLQIVGVLIIRRIVDVEY
jgi:tight adherence protein B